MIILLYLILLYMFAIACSLRDYYTASASLTKMRIERKKEENLLFLEYFFKENVS